MNKKRIAAAAALIIIALLYLATIILAFIDSPFAKNCLMASLFCTIVLPVMAYVYIRLIGHLKEHRESEKKE